MDLGQLIVMAERLGDGIAPDDAAVLRAWLDQAFGTDVLRVDVVRSSAWPKMGFSRSQQAGWAFTFGGVLRDRVSDLKAGWFTRRLFLDERVAAHMGFKLAPAFRGRGLGTELVARAVASYDDLGFDRVTLRAGFDLGRWYWARAGFESLNPAERDVVLDHARSVVGRLGVDVVIADAIAMSTLARLETSMPVTLREVAAVSEAFDQENVLLAAGKSGIELDSPITLGKAILLCGPQWAAELALRSTERRVFDQYVQERRRAVRAG